MWKIVENADLSAALNTQRQLVQNPNAWWPSALKDGATAMAKGSMAANLSWRQIPTIVAHVVMYAICPMVHLPALMERASWMCAKTDSMIATVKTPMVARRTSFPTLPTVDIAEYSARLVRVASRVCVFARMLTVMAMRIWRVVEMTATTQMRTFIQEQKRPAMITWTMIVTDI